MEFNTLSDLLEEMEAYLDKEEVKQVEAFFDEMKTNPSVKIEKFLKICENTGLAPWATLEYLAHLIIFAKESWVIG